LRLTANLDANNQPNLMGILSYSGKEVVVKFYIDIGATFTTLLDYDVSRLGINWRRLNRTAECIGASERSTPYVLPDVIIQLPTENNYQVSLEQYPLDEVYLIPPRALLFRFPFILLGSDRIHRFNEWWLNKPLKMIPLTTFNCRFSLLGMDILKQFPNWYWDFVNKKLVLES
jgi:hypothetical protein